MEKTKGLRKCIVQEKECVFHGWADSRFVNGDGMSFTTTMGIVEDADGVVSMVYPQAIKFMDGLKKNMLYIYESHLGGLYEAEKMLSDEELYCDICSDYDKFVGCVTSKEEAKSLLSCIVEDDGVRFFSDKYVNEFIETLVF